MMTDDKKSHDDDDGDDAPTGGSGGGGSGGNGGGGNGHGHGSHAPAGADESPSHGGGGFTAKLLGDLAKRALTTGIGAVFMSEEALRGQLSEMKLPKEAMGYVVSQADKTKRELIDVIARETRAFFSRLEVEDMIARALTGTTIEITTRVRILPKEGGGVGLAVEKNDSALVPTAPPPTSAAGTPTSADKPRRGRRRRRDDDAADD